MPISKESKDILKKEILVINEQLSGLTPMLEIAKEKRDSAQEKVAQIQAQIDSLKDKKKKLQDDSN